MVAALYVFIVAVWVVALLAVILFVTSRMSNRSRVSPGEVARLERQRRTSIDPGERW